MSMLSRKCKYGLKTMVRLASRVGDGPQLGAGLAADDGIPKRFLEQILLELKRRGLVVARKGPRGGYNLSRAPDQISVGEVVRVLDGPLAPTPCASLTAYRTCDECVDEETCSVRLVMEVVRDATAEILERTTLADLMRGDVYGHHMVGEQPTLRKTLLATLRARIAPGEHP